MSWFPGQRERRAGSSLRSKRFPSKQCQFVRVFNLRPRENWGPLDKILLLAPILTRPKIDGKRRLGQELSLRKQLTRLHLSAGITTTPITCWRCPVSIDTAEVRFSAVRPCRSWVSGCCIKWRIRSGFHSLVFTFVERRDLARYLLISEFNAFVVGLVVHEENGACTRDVVSARLSPS